MSVTITKDNVKKVLKAVEQLTSQEVLVGIPAAKNARSDSPFGNAEIGYLDEFGSPLLNIPPRPHLVPGVQRALPDATGHLQDAGSAALGGDMDGARASLDAAGLVAVSAVRQVIADVIPPPLSPRTLAGRRRKGRPGETPLFDTGEYNQHITHVVRERS